MMTHYTRRLFAFLLLAGIGCATLGGSDARTLRDEADQFLAAEDLESAYRKLVLIRTRHPDSPEASEVFPVAAAIVKRNWWRTRYADPESPWFTSEPTFVFQWFESLATDEFPQVQAERLLLGMPMAFYRRYEEFAIESSVLSQWTFDVEKDNGIVEAIGPARPRE